VLLLWSTQGFVIRRPWHSATHKWNSYGLSSSQSLSAIGKVTYCPTMEEFEIPTTLEPGTTIEWVSNKKLRIGAFVGFCPMSKAIGLQVKQYGDNDSNDSKVIDVGQLIYTWPKTIETIASHEVYTECGKFNMYLDVIVMV
jgi:hypothetical protein